MTSNRARPTAAPGETPGAAVSVGVDGSLAVIGPEPGVSDESLASRAATGDRTAFASLVERYDGRIFRFAMLRVSNRDDATEVTQETFLRAWRSIGRFDPDRRFSTWVLSIAHRESIEVIRRRQRRRRDLDREAPVNEQGAGLELPDLWALARRVLDEASFEAVWLRYVEDRAPAEIAKVMGRTGVSVRVMLHRARARLGEAMASEGIVVEGFGEAEVES